MRVIADHLRAISFAIADGQLPSNNKAGYVIRRILRRAVRYGYTFLGFRNPFMNSLVPLLALQMGKTFPELEAQKDLVMKVMAEEENSFLRTLDVGINKFDSYAASVSKTIEGQFAFELFDTYGFPIDLTQLMAKEKNLDVDMIGFAKCMDEQKNRSRQDAIVDKEDWVVVNDGQTESEFVGYSLNEITSSILKYRKIKAKGQEHFQVILDKTPFYAESGGQLGDKGQFIVQDEIIDVIDTKKENNLIIHIVNKLPQNVNATFIAKIDQKKRQLTMNNHTATHLLHKALKQVLGDHVEQKGSLVSEERLRFDFSHFAAVTNEEQKKIEKLILDKISENLNVETEIESLEEAQKNGAIALFGEKYGENVRVVTIGTDYSKELCGGTHVKSTAQIGSFIIVEETAIASGVRRIEAITGEVAYNYIQDKYVTPLEEIKALLKKPLTELPVFVQSLIENNTTLNKQLEEFQKEKALAVKDVLKQRISPIHGINFIAEKVDIDASFIKDLSFAMRNEIENLFLLLGNISDSKVNLTLMISDNLVADKNWNASQLIREFAKEIQGGGGGQNYFATAGGKKVDGLENAFNLAKDFISMQHEQ